MCCYITMQFALLSQLSKQHEKKIDFLTAKEREKYPRKENEIVIPLPIYRLICRSVSSPSQMTAICRLPDSLQTLRKSRWTQTREDELERDNSSEEREEKKKVRFIEIQNNKIPARIDRKIIVIYWLMVSSTLGLLSITNLIYLYIVIRSYG